jgi:NAD-dependent SIR2 family protein deacetylase
MRCKCCNKIVYEEDVLKWCGVDVCPKCYDKLRKAWEDFGEAMKKFAEGVGE